MRLLIAVSFSLFVHFALAEVLTNSFSPGAAPTIAEVSLIAHPSAAKKPANVHQSKGMSANSQNENGNPEQTWPELVSQPALDYPIEWKAKKMSGVVRAKLKISSLGLVENVEILEAKNNEMAEVAEKAMRSFRFRPALSSGQAIASEIEYAYRFVLR